MRFIYTPVPFIYMHVISKISDILLASNTLDLISEVKEFREELQTGSYHIGCFHMVSASHAPLALQSLFSLREYFEIVVKVFFPVM